MPSYHRTAVLPLPQTQNSDCLQVFIIGASLSEPHSYVLTWTFVIRDKSSVRPLGFVPATVEPKSRANPHTSTLPSVGFDWQRFPLERMPVQEPCSAFLHPVHRVFSCPLRQTRSGYFWQAFCPSLPVFHTQEIDDWRPTLVAVDWLTSFGSVWRRCSKALRKQPMEESNPQRRNGPAS